MKKRNTIQRQCVLDMVKKLNNHPTAEEIYQEIVLEHPNISRGTVYRNLNILADEGDIRRINVPNGADRYDFTLENHYHISCSCCQSFVDVDIPYMADLDFNVGVKTGYIMDSHDIVFFGLCRECVLKLNSGNYFASSGE